MYTPGPTAAEAGAWGLTVEEAQAPPLEVWPDCWQAVWLFDSIGTQWRMGMGGPVGLDYNVLYRKMDRMRLSEADYDETEACVRVMEDAALEVMRKKK